MKQVDGKDLSSDERANKMVEAIKTHFNEGNLTPERLDKYFKGWKEHFEKELTQEECKKYEPYFTNNY